MEQVASTDDNSPPKTLLVGEPGSGKTHAMRTYLDAGLEVFGIITEPMGKEVLLDTPADRFHWMYVPVAQPGFSTLIDNAKKINQMGYDDLANMKSGMNKMNYGQFINLLNALSNFKCDRTGKEYGPVDKFDSTRALFIDSLSGLNTMAMDLVIGAKPTKHQGEWGVAMDNLERLLNMLCGSLHCFFALTAHPAMEKDELTGGTTIMADALGRKLAPRLPRYFSDVIKTQRVESKFNWSTVDSRMALKARNLPWSNDLQPSFVPIVNSWRNRATAATSAA
jgi:hypothetical protein